MRRGALQQLAQAGYSASLLMQFSGHRSVETLLRYLDYGRLYDQANQQGFAAAQQLASAT